MEYFMNSSKTLHPEPLPDIVILDIKLPGGTGFDVLALVRRMKSRLVVAMFTSSCLAEDKQKAEELGSRSLPNQNFRTHRVLPFLALARPPRRRTSTQNRGRCIIGAMLPLNTSVHS
jgi:DNA-binding response OmpR family regulator